jgi:hypothetical protein
MQMGGFEASHQQSQGKWSAGYDAIDLGGGRGARMWVYSFNRNMWYPMKGPHTLPGLNATQLPQYDPVHDIVISTQGSTTWLYNFHTNTAWQLSSPAGFSQYNYSTAVDTRRGLYYVMYSGNLYSFNPESNAWSTVSGSHPPGQASGTGLNMMAYDQVNDVLVYIGDDNGSRIGTWIFSCDSRTWTEVSPAAAPQDPGRLAYNRALNVFALLGGTASGGISRGGSTRGIWAYRYKRGPGPFASQAAAPKAFINTLGSSPVLHWEAVAESGVTGYNIYRGTAATFPKGYTKINSSAVTDTFYTDASAATATPYAYRVCAVKGGTEGEMSRILYARPGRVLGVVASVEDTNVVCVSWDAHPAEEATGYHVYRSRSAAIYAGTFPTGYTKLTASPVAATAYWDTVNGLTDGIARGYVVLAVNGLGNESGVSPECTTFPESPEWTWAFPMGPNFALRWQPPRRTKILGINLYRIHPNETVDPTLLNVMCGGGNFFFDYSARTYGVRLNGTIASPEPITDTVSNWPMPAGASVVNPDITGYYLQSKTFIARAVNLLGQEGFGTDQFSPSNTEYGYGIVIPTQRFDYSAWNTAVEATPAALPASETDRVSAWPNPFKSMVNCSFWVQKRGWVRIAAYDAGGRLVFTEQARAGRGWNRRAVNLSKRASGIYLLRITAQGLLLPVR